MGFKETIKKGAEAAVETASNLSEAAVEREKRINETREQLGKEKNLKTLGYSAATYMGRTPGRAVRLGRDIAGSEAGIGAAALRGVKAGIDFATFGIGVPGLSGKLKKAIAERAQRSYDVLEPEVRQLEANLQRVNEHIHHLRTDVNAELLKARQLYSTAGTEATANAALELALETKKEIEQELRDLKKRLDYRIEDGAKPRTSQAQKLPKETRAIQDRGTTMTAERRENRQQVEERLHSDLSSARTFTQYIEAYEQRQAFDLRVELEDYRSSFTKAPNEDKQAFDNRVNDAVNQRRNDRLRTDEDDKKQLEQLIHEQRLEQHANHDIDPQVIQHLDDTAQTVFLGLIQQQEATYDRFDEELMEEEGRTVTLRACIDLWNQSAQARNADTLPVDVDDAFIDLREFYTHVVDPEDDEAKQEAWFEFVDYLSEHQWTAENASTDKAGNDFATLLREERTQRNEELSKKREQEVKAKRNEVQKSQTIAAYTTSRHELALLVATPEPTVDEEDPQIDATVKDNVDDLNKAFLHDLRILRLHVFESPNDEAGYMDLRQALKAKESETQDDGSPRYTGLNVRSIDNLLEREKSLCAPDQDMNIVEIHDRWQEFVAAHPDHRPPIDWDVPIDERPSKRHERTPLREFSKSVFAAGADRAPTDQETQTVLLFEFIDWMDTENKMPRTQKAKPDAALERRKKEHKKEITKRRKELHNPRHTQTLSTYMHRRRELTTLMMQDDPTVELSEAVQTRISDADIAVRSALDNIRKNSFLHPEDAVLVSGLIERDIRPLAQLSEQDHLQYGGINIKTIDTLIQNERRFFAQTNAPIGQLYDMFESYRQYYERTTTILLQFNLHPPDGTQRDQPMRLSEFYNYIFDDQDPLVQAKSENDRYDIWFGFIDWARENDLFPQDRPPQDDGNGDSGSSGSEGGPTAEQAASEETEDDTYEKTRKRSLRGMIEIWNEIQSRPETKFDLQSVANRGANLNDQLSVDEFRIWLRTALFGDPARPIAEQIGTVTRTPTKFQPAFRAAWEAFRKNSRRRFELKREKRNRQKRRNRHERLDQGDSDMAEKATEQHLNTIPDEDIKV